MFVAVVIVPVIPPDTVSDVRVPTEVSDEVVTFDARTVPVSVPAAAGTVMFPEPSKATPLIVTDEANFVAVEAFPVRFPVTLPVSGPENAAEVTVERPARAVDVAPRAMFVEPIVTDEFASEAFGTADRPMTSVFETSVYVVVTPFAPDRNEEFPTTS
jgi:hypothetical protein